MRWLGCILIGSLIWIAVGLIIAGTMNWSAARPGSLEQSLATRMKYWRVGGKDAVNPAPDSAEVIRQGAEHFQHHCQICHGLDGQNTGVPFANRMSPPVADLASARVQKYTDGQLHWIIQNGIRLTGMPGWKQILSEEESWAIVRYIRHLPPEGSLGAPKVFQEAEEEHESGVPHEHHHQP